MRSFISFFSVVLLVSNLVSLSCADKTVTLPFSETRVGSLNKGESFLYKFLAIPFSGGSKYWNDTIAAVNFNVTVLVNPNPRGVDFDIAAGDESAIPKTTCAESKWQNRSADKTYEFLSFPVIFGQTFYVRVCAYDAAGYFDIKMNYYSPDNGGIVHFCQQFDDFEQDKLAYDGLVLSDADSKGQSSIQFLRGEVLGGDEVVPLYGHRFISPQDNKIIHNLFVNDAQNTLPNTIFVYVNEAPKKYGFYYTDGTLINIEGKDCSSLSIKRDQKQKKVETKLKSNTRLIGQTCTLNTFMGKINYQQTINKTSGDLHIQFFATKYTDNNNVTISGSGYSLSRGSALFYFEKMAKQTQIMIVVDLNRLGKIPKIVANYYYDISTLVTGFLDLGKVNNFSCR